jgi:hypothetical protein|tara:strand:+ start:77 stop:214 length:138 start_codon:yes stop_codon:yes gene_type:complete
MIKDILKLLKSDPFLIGDPDIDIAKGKYEQPMSIKEIIISRKRNK